MTDPTREPLTERSHTPTDDRAWRESFFFGFVDEAAGIGMYNSLGEKPLSSRSGYICTIWGDDVIAETRIAPLERTATEHSCGGLRYRMDESDGSWTVEYEATIPILGPVGHDYVGSVTPDESLPTTDVSMDLRFEPLTPVYDYDAHPAWDRLFDRHVEQSGRFTGSLTIGGDAHPIDALGSRDHSWGPRDWNHPVGWTFFTASFDKGPAFVSLWSADTTAGRVADGYVAHDGTIAKVADVAATIKTGRPRVGEPFSFEVIHESGESTQLVCRAHSSMRHQVGGGKSGPAGHVDRWLVEIESPVHGVGHGEFEMLAPASGNQTEQEEQAA
jgi:hypothetical protein